MPRVKTDHLIPIGYWSGGYPDDQSLPDPSTQVDGTWDEEERIAVVKYLQAAPSVASYRGTSPCRMCGIRNGSQERSDGTYIWPSGFAHYLFQHMVRPDTAFIAHVLAQVSV